MGWDIDLFFKSNYEPVMKDHCPGILSCSSKGRKSIKMSTSAGKTEHLFYRMPPMVASLSNMISFGETKTLFVTYIMIIKLDHYIKLFLKQALM